VTLELQPITIKEAKVFVARHHRHHEAPQGGLFAVAVNADYEGTDGEVVRHVVGVAILGRPVAPERQDGWTAEVSRVCVLEGNPNACSMLYAACWRACRALGYRRCGTYILASEPGTSLRAAGWRLIGMAGDPRGWNRAKRPRVDTHPLEQKELWEARA